MGKYVYNHRQEYSDNAPLKPVEKRIKALQQTTDRVFNEKNIPAEDALRLTKFMNWYHNELLQNDEQGSPDQFLDDYENMITTIELFYEGLKLESIATRVAERIRNIDKAYKKDNDLERYRISHKRVFEILFKYFRSDHVKSFMKVEGHEALKRKNEQKLKNTLTAEEADSSYN